MVTQYCYGDPNASLNRAIWWRPWRNRWNSQINIGGAQHVGKRRESRLSLLVCDSKLNKLVNDLILTLFWTGVRLPLPPLIKSCILYI